MTVRSGRLQTATPSTARSDAAKPPAASAEDVARHVAGGHPLRLAYADPPYPGLAARYYDGHPDFAGEVDHCRLVEQLCDGFPDGWALSTSAAALRDVLASCPPAVRVAAWVRGERPTRSWQPLSAWEPVIYHGGRPVLSPVDERRIDALTHIARARTTDPTRVVGAKPAAFCWWLFDLLGARPGDELVDLFPGSGGVARAWQQVSADSPLFQVLSDGSIARAYHDPSTLTTGPSDASGLSATDAMADTSSLAGAARHVAPDVGHDSWTPE